MPVRQPTAKLRKNRRKGPVQGPETKVRGIKAESGWENAMKASDRRYVVVHVLSVNMFCIQARMRIKGVYMQEQKCIPAVNFKVHFSRMSSLQANSHMIFAEAPVSVCRALQEHARKQTNGNFPLLLVFYRRKCIKAIQPDAPLPTSVMGGAYGGFFHAVKNAIDELAVQAPTAGPWKTVVVRGLIALAALSAGGAAAVQHPKLSKFLKKDEVTEWVPDDLSSNAFEDVMEFDLALGDDFDVDHPEDPLSLP